MARNVDPLLNTIRIQLRLLLLSFAMINAQQYGPRSRDRGSKRARKIECSVSAVVINKAINNDKWKDNKTNCELVHKIPEVRFTRGL
jgi:hypothetical protein